MKMSEPADFVETIIEGFRSLRERPHFELLARQFESGEVSFIVDAKGIQVYMDPEPGHGPQDLDSTLS